jgi:two-component system response regulator HydG
VAINCGAIPESLIESALFGHEKGAFTGAIEVHQGFFERAEGGTLFLDEVDALSPAAQTRLLRVIQEGEMERVGGKHTLHVDVRIVSASNRSLQQYVEQALFRQDLFYRLNMRRL